MKRFSFGQLALICGVAMIFVTGCGSGSSSTSSPPPPPAIIVTITNKISSIAPGDAALTFNATVQNDSSNSGVTWAINAGGSSCQPTCGSLTGATTTSVTYTPPSSVPSAPDNAPTLVATSVADTSKSDSDSFTISTSSNDNGEASGQYAFLVGGFDDATGDQFAYIGSISVNGQGAVTGGIEDLNLPSGVQTSVAITGGTYTLGADNRGTASVTTALGSQTFDFSAGTIVGGVATKLHVIEFDDSNGTTGRRGSGVAYLQNSSAFGVSSLSGPFAFQLVGQAAPAGSRAVEVGGFTVNSGSVTGTIDVNDSTVGFSPGNAFTSMISSTPATATAGRLTNLVTVAGQMSNQVAYIVSSGQILVMTTDSISSGLLSGQAMQQAKTNFTTADMSGTLILYDTGLSSTAGDGYVEAGPMTFNTAGPSGTFDLSTINPAVAGIGTLSGSFSSYAVTANGNVTLTGATALPDFWLINSNEAFMMGTTNTVNSGFIEAQETGTFSNSSISGNYFVGLPQYQSVTAGTVVSGVASSTGNGTLNLTLDSSSAGGQLLTAQSQALTLTLGTPPPSGEFTDSGGGVIFVISATTFVRISPSGTGPILTIAEQ